MNNITELKSFVTGLAAYLDFHYEFELSAALNRWHNTSFTTSSELLGELYLILIEIRALQNIDEKVYKEVLHCISEIKEAFERVGSKLDDPPRQRRQ